MAGIGIELSMSSMCGAQMSPTTMCLAAPMRTAVCLTSEVQRCLHDRGLFRGKVKASSYIAQYPVLRTAQSALHFTSLTDLFTHTPSRLLWEAPSHMLQLMREGCSYTYPPLSIVRYSFKQLSELGQCRVKKLAQGFNTAARIRTRVLVVVSPKLYP